jgi:hypothetical protein
VSFLLFSHKDVNCYTINIFSRVNINKIVEYYLNSSSYNVTHGGTCFLKTIAVLLACE